MAILVVIAACLVCPSSALNRSCVCARQITILAFYKNPLTVDFSTKVVLKVRGWRSLAWGVQPVAPSGLTTHVVWRAAAQDVTIRGIYGRRIWDTWQLTARLLKEGMDVSPVITHRFNGS